MPHKKKSKAYKKAMDVVAGINKTAIELGVRKPKNRGKIKTGKARKAK